MSSAGGFGRKGSVDGAALAARRAAFLAEERARATSTGGGGGGGPSGHAANPVFIREKSTGVAYLLWFFVGGLSVHRFYLGFSTSGAIQASLLPIGYAMMIAGTLAGALPLLASALWVLADAFMIPGLAREANERIRRNATSSVFV